MNTLDEFGARSWESLREYGKDSEGNISCPVTRVACEFTEGQQVIPVVHVVDDELREALQEHDVEYVTSYGFESPIREVVMPNTVSGPEAHGYAEEKWVGVEVEFVATNRWVPVLREDIEAAREIVQEENTGESQATRVGHCQHDETDLYIGRHGENGENDITNTAAGEAGWLGNPFRVGDFDREESIARYCSILLERVESDQEFARALAEDVAGGTVGCWCRTLDEDEPACHGDVVARVADALESSDGDTGGESA